MSDYRERRGADLDLDPRTTLLDALREHLGLTGSKKGCDHGQCGACTVLVNGVRINSCLSLAVMHDGDEVTTIEGVGTVEKLHPMQAAFLDRGRLPVRLLHAGPDLLGAGDAEGGRRQLAEPGDRRPRRARSRSPTTRSASG